MTRIILDVAGLVRLQAPDGWVRVSHRGSRIVLTDPGGPTPIFVEPLPAVSRVETWIHDLARGGISVNGYQQSSTPEARRFILTGSSRGTHIERAYRLHRVKSAQAGSGVWVSASIDLDGNRKRDRLLASVFPDPAEHPNLRNESRQYIEDAPGSKTDGSDPGFSLKLPRSHTIANTAEGRHLVHEGDASVGWMTLERMAAAKADEAAEIETLRNSGTSVQALSGSAWLVSLPDSTASPTAERAAALWVRLSETHRLIVSMSSAERSRGQLEDLLRRIQTDLRVWNDQFHGYWRAPADPTWESARLEPSTPTPPAPPPTPPPDPGVGLQKEWDERLSQSTLYNQRTITPGYDPQFSYFGSVTTRITLYNFHYVTWNETELITSSYAGISNDQERKRDRSGQWSVEIVGGTPQLVLNCGAEGGIHRFDLAMSGAKVTLGGQPYSLLGV